MTLTNFIFLLEIIGTISFAVSGVIVARHHDMDVFGAVVLGCTSAVGGGLIRDLILGITPPMMFRNPVYVLTAAVTSLLFFAIMYAHQNIPGFESMMAARTETLINVTDTAGLAVFLVVGSRTAIEAGYGDNLFLCIFVGTMTGIGGGILRDVLAAQVSLVMSRHIYGLAAILGAAVYCVMIYYGVYYIYASLASMAATCLIRWAAIRYRLNLPAFHDPA